MDEKKLAELTRILHELMYEIGELKERVAFLEDRWAESAPPQPEVEVDEAAKQRILAENYESIGELYQAGYHVCPEFFGQTLKGDCLFCVTLMSRK